jgi:hypothetical protein
MNGEGYFLIVLCEVDVSNIPAAATLSKQFGGKHMEDKTQLAGRIGRHRSSELGRVHWK